LPDLFRRADNLTRSRVKRQHKLMQWTSNHERLNPACCSESLPVPGLAWYIVTHGTWWSPLNSVQPAGRGVPSNTASWPCPARTSALRVELVLEPRRGPTRNGQPSRRELFYPAGFIPRLAPRPSWCTPPWQESPSPPAAPLLHRPLKAGRGAWRSSPTRVGPVFRGTPGSSSFHLETKADPVGGHAVSLGPEADQSWRGPADQGLSSGKLTAAARPVPAARSAAGN